MSDTSKEGKIFFYNIFFCVWVNSSIRNLIVTVSNNKIKKNVVGNRTSLAYQYQVTCKKSTAAKNETETSNRPYCLMNIKKKPQCEIP